MECCLMIQTCRQQKSLQSYTPQTAIIDRYPDSCRQTGNNPDWLLLSPEALPIIHQQVS